jgi:glycosyltransferase involved in cell wall biosynthesis
MPDPADLNVLVVQSTSSVSSEVFVLHSLLRHLEQAGNAAGLRPRVLVLQGIDARGGGSGREAAQLFAGLPGVTLHQMDVGRLGQAGTPVMGRALKLRDALKVRAAQSELIAIARRFRPALVYSAQQIWDLRLAAPLVQTLGVPQAIHLHYHCGDWLGKGTMNVLRDARMVIAVSDFIRGDAINHGVSPERVHSLYNSIDPCPTPTESERQAIRLALRRELGIADNSILVGMCARLAAWKGQEALTEAIAPLMAEDSRVHLLLAGSEYPRPNGVTDRIRRLAGAQGVLPRVHFLGQRTDVPRILDALDIFGHPSRWEPCSIAVLEAAAHSLPVVAWREGGTAYLVSHGETGLLAEPMDIAGLSGALRTLIADEALRRQLGRQGRRRVATSFRPDQAAGAFLGLLEEAASLRARAPLGGGYDQVAVLDRRHRVEPDLTMGQG